MSVLIKGGTVVTADQTVRTDVLCVDGKIQQIAETIDKSGDCEEIDAGGQYIMPGGIDPHTHINPLAPASATLADILGYHYYTELAHSAGLAKADIEDPALTPKDKVARLIENLGPIENTIQYSWLIDIAQTFFDFADDQVTPDNWEPLYDRAVEKMSDPNWSQEVLRISKERTFV